MNTAEQPPTKKDFFFGCPLRLRRSWTLITVFHLVLSVPAGQQVALAGTSAEQPTIDANDVISNLTFDEESTQWLKEQAARAAVMASVAWAKTVPLADQWTTESVSFEGSQCANEAVSVLFNVQAKVAYRRVVAVDVQPREERVVLQLSTAEDSPDLTPLCTSAGQERSLAPGEAVTATLEGRPKRVALHFFTKRRFSPRQIVEQVCVLRTGPNAACSSVVGHPQHCQYESRTETLHLRQKVVCSGHEEQVRCQQVESAPYVADLAAVVETIFNGADRT